MFSLEVEEEIIGLNCSIEDLGWEKKFIIINIFKTLELIAVQILSFFLETSGQIFFWRIQA